MTQVFCYFYCTCSLYGKKLFNMARNITIDHEHFSLIFDYVAPKIILNSKGLDFHLSCIELN
jgi:hypothetical protein